MRVLMEWRDYLERNPSIKERWNRVLSQAVEIQFPELLEAFYSKITGWKSVKGGKNCYWERAEEYGERTWRIKGNKLSLIVLDEGNGWSSPLGVEIDVKEYEYVKGD